MIEIRTEEREGEALSFRTSNKIENFLILKYSGNRSFEMGFKCNSDFP